MSEFQHLAGNLRRFRADLRLSQAQVAEQAGAAFSQQYVSMLERGMRPSDPAHLGILASVLLVPESALLRRTRRPSVGVAA